MGWQRPYIAVRLEEEQQGHSPPPAEEQPQHGPPAPGDDAAPGSSSHTRRWVAVALIGLASIASWHYFVGRPSPGLDSSWQAALHMGARNGMPFGTRLVFTYGPLGFLGFPTPWFTATALLAFVFVAAVHVAFCATIFFAARRRFGLVLSTVLAVLFGAVRLETPEMALLLLALWLLLALQGMQSPRWAPWTAPACGALVAALLLIKLNGGVVGLVMLAIAVWWLPPGGWRAVLRALAAGTVVFAVGFFATGNTFGTLMPYLRNATQIVTGYTDAMSRAPKIVAWQVPVALALAVPVVVLTALLVRRHRIVVVAVATVFVWAQFKLAFVRHEPNRAVAIFVAAALVAVLLPVTTRWQRWSTALVLILAFAIPIVEFGAHDIDPWNQTRWAYRSVVNVGVPGRRNELVDQGKRRIRRQTGVDAAARAALAGQSVHVDPYEASVAWLLQDETTWRPAPVFQSYSAYTPTLDKLNADVLADPALAPSRILRLHRSATIDGRSPDLQTPAYSLAMLCRYRLQLESPDYEVLARADNRCGPATRVGSATARAGRPVRVPAAPGPDQVVLATARFESSLTDRLLTLAFRPPRTPVVVLDGVRHRMIEGTAGDLMMLRVPEDVRPVPQFDMGLDHDTIAFDEVSGPVQLEFFVMPLRADG